MPEDLLIPKQDYLSAGIHIGMKSRTKDMKKFVYKVREDGLAVLDLKTLDERLRLAAKFLGDKKKILAIGRKLNSHLPIKKFAEAVKCDFVIGRFMPGTLTNPNYDKFVEPDAVILTDPLSDYQALKEALDSRIPIIALCDTGAEGNCPSSSTCSSAGFSPNILTYPPKNGSHEMRYSVSPFLNPTSLGPNPMENFSTLIPTFLAARKCPSS